MITMEEHEYNIKGINRDKKRKQNKKMKVSGKSVLLLDEINKKRSIDLARKVKRSAEYNEEESE